MKVYVNHDYKYEVGHLISAFGLKAEFVNTIEEAECVNVHSLQGEFMLVSCSLDIREEVILPLHEMTDLSKKRALKHVNSQVLYKILADKTKKELPWGTLVGVRPVKIVHQLQEEKMPNDKIAVFLKSYYLISDEKIDLLLKVAKAEEPFLEDVYDHPVSLYLSVPFCPSQCLYCSFPSNSVKQKGHLMVDYLDILKKEILAAYEGVKTHHRLLDCIYIGGGTPTTLSVEQFEEILLLLDQCFDLKSLKEFTIEAGRPKTITKEKLEVFKKYHVSRICLNPQTMNDKTLKAIGRFHSVEDIKDTYKLIKSFDFKSINMDLILGLPGETLVDVKKTIDSVLELEPENITVHTLAIKRSSVLNQHQEDYTLPTGPEIKAMIEMVADRLDKEAYKPYYLYRQKNMAGNFENVGYAKEGHISRYNVRIIEEQHSILALGPGAVSKKCSPDTSYFERIPTIKGLEQYIDRKEEVIEKVRAFFL